MRRRKDGSLAPPTGLNRKQRRALAAAAAGKGPAPESAPAAKRRKLAKVDAAAFWKENKIQITGMELPVPALTFATAGLPMGVEHMLNDSGYVKPSPIQSAAWPIVKSGRDVVAVARTGSGKTLAFLLPAMMRIQAIVAGGGGRKAATGPMVNACQPLGLVLAPTRELAVQIHDEAKRFATAYSPPLTTGIIFGGTNKKLQIATLRCTPPLLIVATPGRLLDLHSMRVLSLARVRVLCLDEADRLLDLGFANDIQRIADAIGPGDADAANDVLRQTLLFTATWPQSVVRVAASVLRDPVRIAVGNYDGGNLVANESVTQVRRKCLHSPRITRPSPRSPVLFVLERHYVLTTDDQTQHVMVVPQAEKAAALTALLATFPAQSKVIVFTRTKRGCARTCAKLWDAGYACDALHGDREQWERSDVMAKFKIPLAPRPSAEAGATFNTVTPAASTINLLLATDVAARGLDVKDISHVVNLDFPQSKGKAGIEEYVHRIGRTGRAGATGDAYTFFEPEIDYANAAKLIALLKEAKQAVLPALEDIAASFQPKKAKKKKKKPYS